MPIPQFERKKEWTTGKHGTGHYDLSENYHYLIKIREEPDKIIEISDGVVLYLRRDEVLIFAEKDINERVQHEIDGFKLDIDHIKKGQTILRKRDYNDIVGYIRPPTI